jgi:hypothetical protein
MAHRMFTCPETSMIVQHWLDEDDDGVSDNTYQVVTCPACTKVHLINRKTGKLLSEKMHEQRG